MTKIELDLITKIEDNLEELYNRISPLDVEIRERVWKAWDLIMDARIRIEDEIGD